MSSRNKIYQVTTNADDANDHDMSAENNKDESEPLTAAENQQANVVDVKVDAMVVDETEADIKCGIPIFQRFANQSTFVIVYGIIGCVLSMTYAYFNGTITTLEKRFHLSSRSIGITQVGNDFTQMITSIFFIYYVGKSHKPRFMGLGVFTLFLYCVLTTLPHWIYGPGEESLELTLEYGAVAAENITSTTVVDDHKKSLCDYNRTFNCDKADGVTASRPMLVLFLSHSISGIGYSLYYSLGYAYMDDNVDKSKTASMYTFSYFLNMLGPSIGYTMAAFCLRQFISPSLHPVIDNKDPRWIGAWWLGWLIFGSMLFVCGVILSLFPKEMPASYRKRLLAQNQKQAILQNTASNVSAKTSHKQSDADEQTKPSFNDLLQTFKRITRNKIFMMNNLSSVFYFFGYMPYWIFSPKYLEIQYRLSAAESNIYTGTVALVFTAVGVLISGVVVSRKKPRARLMAGWNATVGFVTVIGLLSYSLIGCSEIERRVFVENLQRNQDTAIMCAESCRCDYVSYAPVCGENNLTYISACHAGCKAQEITNDGQKLYNDCDCVVQSSLSPNSTLFTGTSSIKTSSKPLTGGTAKPGACAVNCLKSFLTFLSVMCFLKFIGATTRANYFLIQVRSVSPADKAVALAFGMVLMSLLSFVPSPIFFGWLLDRMCLVWGKTCTEKGNCWLYDSYALRYYLNWTAASFVCLGALSDCTVWYFVKDLKVFDDDEKKVEEDKIEMRRSSAIKL